MPLGSGCCNKCRWGAAVVIGATGGAAIVVDAAPGNRLLKAIVYKAMPGDAEGRRKCPLPRDQTERGSETKAREWSA